MFEFNKDGNIVHCTGNNFEYARVGKVCRFVQKGKIPSLRIIKTLIKKLEQS